MFIPAKVPRPTNRNSRGKDDRCKHDRDEAERVALANLWRMMDMVNPSLSPLQSALVLFMALVGVVATMLMLILMV